MVIRRQLICGTDEVKTKVSDTTWQINRDILSTVREILVPDYKAQGKSIWAALYSYSFYVKGDFFFCNLSVQEIMESLFLQGRN